MRLNKQVFWLVYSILLLSYNSFVNALSVGVTPGPHTIIMQEIKKEASAKYNLNIKIVEFNDFILPNAALAAGDIDINCYQHQPFLNEQIKSRGYRIVAIAKTILMPLGIYSLKHKSITNIPEGAKISIPNDPTNNSRALLLLAQNNLITLKTLNNPSMLDITENPKRLKFIELEAPQIPRTLQDVDYGITNTDWILISGIDPRTAITQESTNSMYANLIVAREQNQHDPEIKTFVKIYQSQYMKNFILNIFKGAILPAW